MFLPVIYQAVNPPVLAAQSVTMPPFAINSAAGARTWRVEYEAPYEIRGRLTVGIGNFCNSPNGETAPTATMEGLTVGLELPNASSAPSGVVKPLLFHGATTTSVPAGGYAEAQAFVKLGAHSKYWLRMSFATAGSYAGSVAATASKYEFLTLGNVAHGGSMGTFVSAALYPAAVRIAGERAPPTPHRAAILGDSVAEGDAAGGFIGRSLSELGWAWTRLAKGGQRIDHQYGTAFVIRSRLLADHDVAIVNAGLNDLFQGATLWECESRYLLLWESLRAAGIKYVVQCTLTPRTSSLDGWATPFQVPASFSELIEGLNAWFREQAEAGRVWAVAEVGAEVRDSGNPYFWDSNGTAWWLTADGTHPTGAGYDRMAVPLSWVLGGF